MARKYSIKRITEWSSFLAAALLIGLSVWYLPMLLRLDQFRPQFKDLLEKTFHCRAEIGHVRGALFPSPALTVSRMSLLEAGPSPRLLASGNVRVSLEWKALIHGQLVFTSMRFTRPRFLAHRDVDAHGVSHWMGLAALQETSNQQAVIDDVAVRSGSLEVWDHSVQPTRHWIVSEIDGQLQLHAQAGALTGKVPFLGRHCLLDAHYQGAAPFPINVHITGVSLAAIPVVLHSSFSVLAGTADVLVQARLRPDVEVRVTVPSLDLTRLNGVRLRGSAAWQNQRLTMNLKSLTSAPMEISVDANLPPATWKLTGTAKGYDPVLVRSLYDQDWLNRLSGGGTVTFAAQAGPVKAPSEWSWFAEGTGFLLANSPFRLAEWSAQGNAHDVVVDVRPITADGGSGEVVWEKPAASSDAQLTVNISSVTVRQILETFDIQSKTRATGSWNSYGYESWVVQKADMESVIHDGNTLEIQDSDIDAVTGTGQPAMHVDLAGSFPLQVSTEPAHIQGDVLNVALEPLLLSYMKPPAALTGQAQAEFNLNFPVNAMWLNGFSGSVHLTAINGVLRELKTLYRVMSVLNLMNYVEFHMPQVSAQGILFQSLQGHLWFKNGLLVTDDLFLKSPNMNIGVNGAADLLMKRVDVKLRVEMLRFLEDVLKAVPITHWIFKKPNKIFLPVVVNVKGPWENPDVR